MRRRGRRSTRKYMRPSTSKVRAETQSLENFKEEDPERRPRYDRNHTRQVRDVPENHVLDFIKVVGHGRRGRGLRAREAPEGQRGQGVDPQTRHRNNEKIESGRKVRKTALRAERAHRLPSQISEVRGEPLLRETCESGKA